MDRRARRSLTLILTALVLPSASAIGMLPPTPFGAWMTEAVHEPCWRNYANDIAIGPDGTVHVVHQGCIETIAAGTMPRPVYSRRQGLGWEHFEFPKVGDDVKIALSPTGVAHVAFLELVYNVDFSEFLSRQVTYAAWNGAAFDTEVAYSGSGFVWSITLDAQDRPAILAMSNGVRVLTRTAPGTWSSTLLNPNPNGIAGDMAVGPDGRLRVIEQHGNSGSYTAGVTYYEQQPNGTWTSEPAALGCFGGPRLAIDSQNNAHVSCEYVGPEGPGLYYAKRISGVWSVQLVAALNPNTSDIKLDANNQPHIVYSTGALPGEGVVAPVRYAVIVNGKFMSESVITRAVVVDRLSLALDDNGIPAIVTEQFYERGFSVKCGSEPCVGKKFQTVLVRPALALVGTV